jgi:hypothetical protein
MELRVYDIPRNYEEVQHELNIVLSGPSKSGETSAVYGRASMTPDGRMLLLAPADIQRAVAAFLKELPQQKGAPSVFPTITMTYWFVAGRPGGKTPDLSTPPWKEIALPLQEIVNSQGPMEFDIMEKLAVVDSGKGNEVKLQGEKTGILQHTRVEDGKVVAAIQSLDPHGLRSEITLTPGQFVVLAQVGFTRWGSYAPFKDSSGNTEERGNTMFYIVRAQTGRQL